MRQIFFSFFTATVWVVLFFAGISCQSPTQAVQSKDSLETELDDIMPGLLGRTAVPGISIAVIRDGKLVLAKGYGLADKSLNAPVDTHTIFQIGSVSKTVTALAILKLAEEGKINLDEPIGTYLKSWRLPQGKYDNSKVTTRMVLSHTAGLSVRGYHGVFKPGDKLPSLQESLNGYSGSDGRLELINEPGNSFQYSSGGYTLLQLLIQDVTDLSFSDYMDQTVFLPFEMKNTSYSWAVVEKSVATPYNEEGKPRPHYQFAEAASGGLYTTAPDLAKLLTLFCKDGRTPYFLKPGTILQMITATPGTENKYGLGCKIFSVNEKQNLIMHDGANEGWRAGYYIHPQTGDGIVVLMNSDLGGKIVAPVLCTVFKRTAVDLSGLCSQLSK